MDLEFSKGYFPKFGQSKTFDIHSKESKTNQGEITFSALSKDESLDDNASKIWDFQGRLNQVNSEIRLYYGEAWYNRRPKNKTFFELFGERPTKTVITDDITFAGRLYYQEDEEPSRRYTFQIERVLSEGKILEEKTGKMVWEENYNVPYPSGKYVDEMQPIRGWGISQSNQKAIGQEILDKVERLIENMEREKFHEENTVKVENVLLERQMEREIKLQQREKRKKQIPVMAGIVGVLVALGYYFGR